MIARHVAERWEFMTKRERAVGAVSWAQQQMAAAREQLADALFDALRATDAKEKCGALVTRENLIATGVLQATRVILWDKQDWPR